MNFWYQYNANVGDIVHNPPEVERVRANDFVPYPHSEPFFSGELLQPPLKKYKKGIIISGERPGTRWRKGDEIEEWNKRFQENEGFIPWDGHPRKISDEDKKEKQLSEQLRQVLRPELLREKDIKKDNERKPSTDVRSVIESLKPGEVPLVMEHNIPAPVTAKTAVADKDVAVDAIRSLPNESSSLPATSSDTVPPPRVEITKSERGLPLYTLAQMRNNNSNKDKLPSIRDIESIAKEVIVPLFNGASVRILTSATELLSELDKLVAGDTLPDPETITNFCHSTLFDLYGTTQYLLSTSFNMFSGKTQLYDPVSIFLRSEASLINVSNGIRQYRDLMLAFGNRYKILSLAQGIIPNEGRKQVLILALASRLLWQLPVDLDAEYRLTGTKENAIQYILNPEHTTLLNFLDIWDYFSTRIRAFAKDIPARDVIPLTLTEGNPTFDVSKLKKICESGEKYAKAEGKAVFGDASDIMDWNVNLNTFLIGAYYFDADKAACFRFLPRDVIVWFNYLLKEITKARSISTQGANEKILTPAQKQERTKRSLAHEERQNETRRQVNQARSTQALQRAREQLTAETTYRTTPL